MSATPPDSGELCNQTLGEDRVVYQCSRPKGHIGQHRDGNITAWDQKPDSGERDVCKDPECPHPLHGAARGPVSLPRPLAQRILAALEGVGAYAAARWDTRALADELRKEMGK